jgi:hypothetical protein
MHVVLKFAHQASESGNERQGRVGHTDNCTSHAYLAVNKANADEIVTHINYRYEHHHDFIVFLTKCGMGNASGER